MTVFGESKSTSNIVVKNFESFKDENVVSLQLEFEEAIGDKKKS